jgi:hypothetical protein
VAQDTKTSKNGKAEAEPKRYRLFVSCDPEEAAVEAPTVWVTGHPLDAEPIVLDHTSSHDRSLAHSEASTSSNITGLDAAGEVGYSRWATRDLVVREQETVAELRCVAGAARGQARSG